MRGPIAPDRSVWLPEAASTAAERFDPFFDDLIGLTAAATGLVVGCLVAFAYRQRRRPGQRASIGQDRCFLPWFVALAWLVLSVALFHRGATDFMFLRTVPPDAITVRARGQSWLWEFEQPNGMTDSELVVPVHRPVRVVLSSLPAESAPAVIHGFYVPAFRIQADVVPGMLTSVWFEATRTGTFPILCTEYCGTGHSRMASRIRVVSAREWSSFLRGPGSPPPVYESVGEWGEALFASNGCVACHNRAEGAGRLVGPNLWGVAGTVQLIEEKGELLAGYDYLRESIRYPEACIVQGYQNQMVSYANMQSSLLDALIVYLATLSPDGGQTVLDEMEARGIATELDRPKPWEEP